MAIAYLERALPATDVVRFDGHRLHPLNLASVLMHDDRRERLRLAASAPLAFPHWRKRIGAEGSHEARMRDKSVLLLVSTNRLRGAEVFGQRLAEGFGARGWDVDFVALSGSSDSPAVSAVALRESIDGGRLDKGLVRLLRSRIARNRPAVVFANGGATLRYAVTAMAGMRDKPKLVYASIGEPAYWLRHSRHRTLQAMLHRQVDLVIAVSAQTRKQLLELFHLEPERVKVAYTGVPDSLFDVPAKTDSANLRMVFLGNLSEEKGPQSALGAVRQLTAEAPAQLRFVGDGPQRARLESAVARLGLSEVVEFTGSVADVRLHLAWADVLILTSQTEGFPGVVLEAAAAGTPAVAYDVGGTAETIVDGVTGIVVPAGDKKALLAALKTLAGDRVRARAMGEAARARVREEFLLGHAVDRYDDLVRSVAGIEPRLPTENAP
jgi:glycosyltransferase involved in cell wall biosynthesis